MTKIEWCDETINPVVGCTATSPGCQNCYAEKMARRLAAMGKEQYKNMINQHGEWEGLTEFVPSELEKPSRWKKPRSIFVSSMGDLFHDSVDHVWHDRVMRMIWDNPRHTFIFLTKRPENMLRYFQELATPGTETDTSKRLFKNPNYAQQDHGWRMKYLKGGSLPNLVLGVSVENQHAASHRIPLLLQAPAAARFISLEPMLGPVDLERINWPYGYGMYKALNALTGHEHTGSGLNCDKRPPRTHLDGVILGGESGPKARPMHPEWIRLVRDQCKAAGVPFMFKQWGEWRQTIAPWEPRPFGIFPDGKYYQAGLLMGPINAEAIAIAESHAGQEYERIHRVGSKSAGNMLDGRTHTDLPWKTRKTTC